MLILLEIGRRCSTPAAAHPPAPVKAIELKPVVYAPEKPREITPPRRVSAKPDPEPAGPAAPPTPTGPPGPNRKKSQRWSASDVAQRPGAVQSPPAPGNKRNVLQRKKSLKEMGQTEESMLVARVRLRPRVERPYMAFLHEGVARGRSLSSRIKS